MTGFADWFTMQDFIEMDLSRKEGETTNLLEVIENSLIEPGENRYVEIDQAYDNRNRYKEQLDDRSDYLLATAGVGLALLMGSAPLAQAVGIGYGASELLVELLNDVNFEEPEVEFDRGFGFEYHIDNIAENPVQQPGCGHFVTFDAYVSPGSGTETFEVVSFNEHVPSPPATNVTEDDEDPSFADSDVQDYYDFYPEVTWTVAIDRRPRRDEFSGNDQHTARIQDCNAPAYLRTEDGQVDPPVVDFRISPQPGNASEPVEFENTSHDGGGTLDDIEWELTRNDGRLPDGFPSPWTTEDVSVTVPPGEYTMSLEVINDMGKDTRERDFLVTEWPTASMDIEGRRTPGATVTLDASDSTDPNDSIEHYHWHVDPSIEGPDRDLEDIEETFSGVEAEYEFPDSGEYDITLIVTNEDGGFDSAGDTIIVTEDPEASFTIDGPLDPEAKVTLDASDSADPDGSIDSYDWHVDPVIKVQDGPNQDDPELETNLSGVAPEYTFPDPGNYTIRLTVTDDDGATGISQRTFTVTEDPTAEFLIEGDLIVGETVTLDASGSTDSDGTIERYDWFVDPLTDIPRDIEPIESELTGTPAEYEFPVSGTYRIDLTVTDDDGAIGTTSREITVVDSDESPSEPTSETSSGGATETTTSTAESTSPTPTSTGDDDDDDGIIDDFAEFIGDVLDELTDIF